MRSDLLRGWRPMVGVVAVGVLACAWNLYGASAESAPGVGAVPVQRGGGAQVLDVGKHGESSLYAYIKDPDGYVIEIGG